MNRKICKFAKVTLPKKWSENIPRIAPYMPDFKRGIGIFYLIFVYLIDKN